MRYRMLATYRGVPYEAGVGPAGADVVLFAACPPPEELGFEPATGHWRKKVIRAEVDALWESRPVGTFGGEPCIVLDDLGDRLHIAYVGNNPRNASRLGYWQIDRGVYELLTPREDVTGLTEERVDRPLRAAPPPADSGAGNGTGTGPADVLGPPDLPGEPGAAAGPGQADLDPPPAAPAWPSLEPAQSDVAEREVAEREVAEREMAEREMAEREMAEPEPGRPEPALSEPPLPKRSRAEPGLAESAATTAASPEPAPPGAASPEPAPPGAASPEPAPPGVASLEPGVPGLERPEPARPGLTSPDPAPPGLALPEPAPPEPALPDRPLPEPSLLAAAGQGGSEQSTPEPGLDLTQPLAARRPPPLAPPAPPQPAQSEPVQSAAGQSGVGQSAAAEPYSAYSGPPPTLPAAEQQAAQSAPPPPATSPAQQDRDFPAPPTQYVPAPPGQHLSASPGQHAPAEHGPPQHVPAQRESASQEMPRLDMTQPVPARHEPAHAGRRSRAAENGSRTSRRQRVATRDVFCELADLAGIPRAAYALEAEVDGVLCLLATATGYEVFVSADGARHEVRSFPDEEAAYFYLFGVLVAEAIRNGALTPAAPHDSPV